MTSAVSRLTGLAAIAAASFTTAAFAGLPTGTLQFIAPNGTAGPNDTIDVWVRLTLDANSAPLTFSTDPQTGLLTGFAPEDLPTKGWYWDAALNQNVESTFAKFTGAQLNAYFACVDGFTSNCNFSTSNYSFDFGSAQPGMPSLNAIQQFSLAPGQATDYVFAHFIPKAGGADAGVYKFYSGGLFLYFRGVDAAGHELLYSGFNTGVGSTVIARSCPTYSNDCAFTRTVVAVPEPATYGLMALGLAALGVLARRRATTVRA